MTRRLIAGTGWKMTHGAAATVDYGQRLLELLGAPPAPPIDIFVLPPHTSLAAAGASLLGSPVKWGGQNMHEATRGPWTGEVSPAMLAEAGCRYVELAHSERLEHFGETYERVQLKVRAAFEHGLIPIVCLGESAEEKRRGEADAVLRHQVETALALVPASRISEVILAYEPRWAIGSPEPAGPDYVSARHATIRDALREPFGPDTAEATRIIYGGAVTVERAPNLIALPEVDGLFVGRAAWTPEGFIQIIQAVNAAAQAKEHSS